MRKSVVEGIYLEPSIKYGEDALFLWNILLKIKALSITNEILYHVTLHDDSASGGGSYKPIRRDCIKVWNIIAENASEKGKDYEIMAKAQLANMAFFSLYEMMYYEFQNKKDEDLFLSVIKKNYKELKSAAFISKYEKIFSVVMLHSVVVSRIFIYIRKRLSK
jgi:hypothetical protein